MPLRPDEIENREFASSLRGFDKHEVRAFLRRVASDVEELETELSSRELTLPDERQPVDSLSMSPVSIDEDRFAALGDRIANLLRQAHEAAAETKQQSEERAVQLRSVAEDELERARVDAGRLREEAEANAVALRSQVEEESSRLRAEAEHLKAEADRLHSDASAVRGEAEQQVNQLRAEADHYAEQVRGEAETSRGEAEQYSNQLRSEAEALKSEADRLHAEAQAVREEADSILAGAEQHAAHLRAQAEAEADGIRDRAEAEGAARLDERRLALEDSEAQMMGEREAATAEVAEARRQVSSLLEEARAQSEFIKREAEEIIRAKVRTNIDQAQRRIDVLRNTETSSRNRILTAQRELEAALNRLDSEDPPELGADTEEAVLVEAEQRSIEAEYPPFRTEREASSPVEAGDEWDSDEAAGAVVIEGEIIEIEAVEIDVVDAQLVEDDWSDDSDDSEYGDDFDVVPDPSETSYRPSAEAHEPDGDADLDPDEVSMPPAATPENEDALARLVREAMQRVVEDARNDNP